MSPIQRPTPRAPAQPLGQCLGHLERQWQSEGSLAALWQAWPEIAGAQLAPHCRPLALRGNTLVVGARNPNGCKPCATAAISCWRCYAAAATRLANCSSSSTTPPKPASPSALNWTAAGASTPAASLEPPPTAPAAEPRARAGKSSVGAAAPSACTNQQLEAEMAADQPGG